MMYFIIYLTETDGEIEVRTIHNKVALKTFFTLGEGRVLDPTEYALIKGINAEVIKTFDNKTFDLKGEMEDAKTDGNK